ncbi:uncharacterized protein LOC117119344 [Anneissia japonica]|uniref:uncharacterized protein LOC117119344 n=1 Tax=Anneissia japonica TaxID=1529436 RepID=UPI0014258354|nr:uncharacterized protein LOC117119344 [Anneissia japonica]
MRKMGNSTAFTIALSVFVLLNVATKTYSRTRSKEGPVDTRNGGKLTEEEDKIRFFNPVDIPSPFRLYDLNKDGVVTLAELAKATDTTLEDARGPFRSADSNSDKKLSYKEFLRAPWIFRAEDVIDEESWSFVETGLK